MKVTCCCLTCIIGQAEKEEQKEETSQLLQDDDDNEECSPIRDKQPTYSRSTSAISNASARGLTAEGVEPNAESVADGQQGGTKEKFSKAVGVLKKYNVMSSKYNTKELQRQLSQPAKLRLKVGIKIMPRSSTVKVSVIEAHDVMPIMQFKGLPDLTAGSIDQDQPMVVQVRTKIMHSEVRGHTRKYEIQGGVTGALKLRNETIHTVDLEEFMHCKIRFRLYFVLKHHRDKLLGEYTLDIPSLNIDTNNPMTHTMLELSDPSLAEADPSVKSPELVPIPNRMSSTESQQSRMQSIESQPSTDRDSQSLSTPKIQRQAKIRSQDSDIRKSLNKGNEKGSLEYSLSTEKSEEDVSSKKSISKAFKSIRQGASHVLSRDHSSKEKETSTDFEEPIAATTEQMTVNERLRMAAKERSEKVEELEEATAAMADTASNFSALSVKLKEKYMAQSGKKSKSSET